MFGSLFILWLLLKLLLVLWARSAGIFAATFMPYLLSLAGSVGS
jgi:hypothetical protein